MSDINQNVNINVNANTQDAGRDVEKLEQNIATLDGAINVVGGSIEVLAGALAISGAVSEEQAQKFESAAIGAIALADGSKRIIEGYKTLATQTKVLTVVQRIYNTVMKANPVFLIIGVLAAVTAGVIALAKATKRNREEQEALNSAIDQATKTQDFYNNLIAEAQARGESQLSILFKQAAASRARVRGLDDELKALQAIKNPSDEELERLEALPGLIDDAAKASNIAQIRVETESARIRKEREDKAEQERKDAADKRKEENDLRIAEEQRVQEELLAAEKARIEAIEQAELDYELGLADRYDAILQQQLSAQERELNAVRDKYYELEEFYANDAEALKNITEQRDKEVLDINNKYRKEDEVATSASEKVKNEIINGSIDNLQGALAALFGENKAVASANVLIDAGQAAVGIIKNSQTTGPLAIAYQASQFALLAATTAASLKQINSAQPGSTGGSPNIPQGGGITGPLTSTARTPFIGFNGQAGFQNLQAVVIAGDVTSAQAQDAIIRNRRRFG